MWLAQALEALYETPSLGIVEALRERIALVLDAPEAAMRKTRKVINDMYKARSAFAHGKADIVNPAICDKDGWESYPQHDVWIASDWARAMIVSTLQRMIKNGWTKIQFRTEFTGE
jgi:hypothetical protein